MPRGVYKRKPRKSPPTIGDIKLSTIFAPEGLERIAAHCRGNNMMIDDFIKKCVYDNVPVCYTVDETFVLPFGKYVGESAGTVARMDPDYLKWCQRTIKGFNLVMTLDEGHDAPIVMDGEVDNSKGSTVEGWQLQDALRPHLVFGENLKINRLTAWAHNPSTDRWRKLAKRNAHGTWTLCV